MSYRQPLGCVSLALRYCGLMATDETIAQTEIEIDADADAVRDAISTDGGLSDWIGDGSSTDPTPGGELFVPEVVIESVPLLRIGGAASAATTATTSRAMVRT
jgi:hypothetical protein